MPLSDVLHQDAAQQRVQRALRAGRVPHAYLFTGPDGIGKEMLATRLAAVLLCEHAREIPLSEPRPSGSGGLAARPDRFLTGAAPPDQSRDREGAILATSASRTGHEREPLPHGRGSDIDACGQCEDCVLLASDNHPDFHRIYRTLNRFHPDSRIQKLKATLLSIDVIRHFLIERVGLHPSRGRAKVFLILEADRLSGDAQNAMLKTLEEPAGHSYLILISRSADALLPTTRSRCQQIAFRTLPMEFVTEGVTARKQLGGPAARFLAELSQGSLGLALRYAELRLHERLPVVWEAVRATAVDPLRSAKTLLETAKELAPALKDRQDEEDADTNANREAQKMMLSMAATIVRDVQRVAVGSAPVAVGGLCGTGFQPVELAARSAGPRALGRAIRALGAAEYQIDANVNAPLIFDAVGIELGRALGGRK
jgi:DNA polymerase-3 subunit delta'